MVEGEELGFLDKYARVILFVCLIFLVFVIMAVSVKVGGMVNCAKSQGEYVKHGWVGACIDLNALGHCEKDGNIYFDPDSLHEKV